MVGRFWIHATMSSSAYPCSVMSSLASFRQYSETFWTISSTSSCSFDSSSPRAILGLPPPLLQSFAGAPVLLLHSTESSGDEAVAAEAEAWRSQCLTKSWLSSCLTLQRSVWSFWRHLSRKSRKRSEKSLSGRRGGYRSSTNTHKSSVNIRVQARFPASQLGYYLLLPVRCGSCGAAPSNHPWTSTGTARAHTS